MSHIHTKIPAEAEVLAGNPDLDDDAGRAWIAVRLHGLPQTIVASKLGVDRKTVHRWLEKIDDDVADYYSNTPGLTLLACEIERVRHQETRVEQDVYRLRQKFKVVDGEPRWTERTELAICRQEKLLLEIRRSRCDLLIKTGLIATGIENRDMLRDSLERPKNRHERDEDNGLSNEQILQKIKETLKKTKFIQ